MPCADRGISSFSNISEVLKSVVFGAVLLDSLMDCLASLSLARRYWRFVCLKSERW